MEKFPFPSLRYTPFFLCFMFNKLSFLFRKSRKNVLSTVLQMSRKGYSMNDIAQILRAVMQTKLKPDQIKKARTLIDKNKKAKAAAATPPGAPFNAEIARIFDREFGHKATVDGWICQNAQGEPIPWYTYPMIEFIEQLDFSEKRVFEFGSGYSTLFWAGKAKHVVAVEDDSKWFDPMSEKMPSNVTYLHRPEKNDYLQAIHQSQEKYDLVIISGSHRPDCVEGALARMKPDGMVILDNADWFPGIAKELREHGLIQVDMHGFGPINSYTWTTSLFLSRSFNVVPRSSRLPAHGPGSIPNNLDVASVPSIEKPSLNDLDNKLAKYLNFKGGFFIEAGGNDGFSQSNSYYLENSLGWKGVLVEAIPDLAVKCHRTRARSKVHHCALGSDPEKTPFVTMRYANLMSVVQDSMEGTEATEAHVNAGLQVQNIDASYSVDVPVKTLTSVLDTYENIPRIDFLSLDVEGYELEVLKGLDLNKYTPEYILVETSKLDQVTEMLGSRYRLIDQLSVHDYLFHASGH